MPQNLKTESVALDIDALPQLPDHEHEFIRLMLFENKNASEAYRLTHDTKGKPESVWSMASLLKGSTRIQEWISAYKRLHNIEALKTADGYLQAVTELSEEARKAGNYGAAMNGYKIIGTATGNLIERSEVTHRKTGAEELLEALKSAKGVTKSAFDVTPAEEQANVTH